MIATLADGSTFPSMRRLVVGSMMTSAFNTPFMPPITCDRKDCLWWFHSFSSLLTESNGFICVSRSLNPSSTRGMARANVSVLRASMRRSAWTSSLSPTTWLVIPLPASASCIRPMSAAESDWFSSGTISASPAYLPHHTTVISMIVTRAAVSIFWLAFRPLSCCWIRSSWALMKSMIRPSLADQVVPFVRRVTTVLPRPAACEGLRPPGNRGVYVAPRRCGRLYRG